MCVSSTEHLGYRTSTLVDVASVVASPPYLHGTSEEPLAGELTSPCVALGARLGASQCI